MGWKRIVGRWFSGTEKWYTLRVPAGYTKVSTASMESRVLVWFDYAHAETCITFVEERGGVTYAAKHCPIEFVEWPEGTEHEPTFRIRGRDLGNSLLKQLADALSEVGIRTDHDYKIQGKLEAVQYHLEDLRTLLKLKK